MFENSLGIDVCERVVFGGARPRSHVNRQVELVEDLCAVGAELWRRPGNATRRPREPGWYARGAHRSVRGVHCLEPAYGLEMRISEPHVGRVQSRGRYLACTEQPQP